MEEVTRLSVKEGESHWHVTPQFFQGLEKLWNHRWDNRTEEPLSVQQLMDSWVQSQLRLN